MRPMKKTTTLAVLAIGLLLAGSSAVMAHPTGTVGLSPTSPGPTFAAPSLQPAPSSSSHARWTSLAWAPPVARPPGVSDVIAGGDGYLAFGSQQADGVSR